MRVCRNSSRLRPARSAKAARASSLTAVSFSRMAVNRGSRRSRARPAPLSGIPRMESCRKARKAARCWNPSSVTLKHRARLSSSSGRRDELRQADVGDRRIVDRQTA